MKHSGNILFLILIAVALFAALSYAITSTSRTSTSSISDETSLLKAAKLIQFGDNIKRTMQNRSLLNQCNFEAINANDAFGDPTTYTNKCNVFNPANGAYVPYDADLIGGRDNVFINQSANLPFPGKGIYFFNSMRVVGIGVPDWKEVIMFAFNIDDEICKGINKSAGVEGDPMQENSPYEGNFTNPIGSPTTASGLSIGDGATNLVGKNYGCYKAARSGTLNTSHFYYVLLER